MNQLCKQQILNSILNIAILKSPKYRNNRNYYKPKTMFNRANSSNKNFKNHKARMTNIKLNNHKLNNSNLNNKQTIKNNKIY